MGSRTLVRTKALPTGVSLAPGFWPLYNSYGQSWVEEEGGWLAGCGCAGLELAEPNYYRIYGSADRVLTVEVLQWYLIDSYYKVDLQHTVQFFSMSSEPRAGLVSTRLGSYGRVSPFYFRRLRHAHAGVCLTAQICICASLRGWSIAS